MMKYEETSLAANLRDKVVERGALVVHESAHEDLRDFVCTEERHEERAVLGHRGAEDVPSRCCL